MLLPNQDTLKFMPSRGGFQVAKKLSSIT